MNKDWVCEEHTGSTICRALRKCCGFDFQGTYKLIGVARCTGASVAS